MKSWLALQQLLDSALPIGGFSHSFGLETMVQEGRIRSTAELESYIETMLLQSWSTSDAMIVRAVYESVPAGDWERVFRIERLVHVGRISAESRSGVEKMGRRLLQLAGRMFPAIELSPLTEGLRGGRCFASHPLVYGVLGQKLDIEQVQAIEGLLYSNVITSVNSALRLMPIGQTEGQALAARLGPIITEAAAAAHALRPEEAYSAAPMAELMMMRHETLYSRLFMS